MKSFRSALAACVLVACSDVTYVHEPPPVPATVAADTQPALDDAGTDAKANAEAGVCPAPPPEGDPAWKPPPAPANVCTAADLAYIASISGPTATYQDVADRLASRNAACSACIFSHDVDDTWGPIVLVGPATKGRGIVNMGACFASVAGGSVGCGRTVEQLELCVDAVCDVSECADESARQLCVNAAAHDVAQCGHYDVNRACGGPDSYASLVSVCRTGFDAIRALCGGKD